MLGRGAFAESAAGIATGEVSNSAERRARREVGFMVSFYDGRFMIVAACGMAPFHHKPARASSSGFCFQSRRIRIGRESSMLLEAT